MAKVNIVLDMSQYDTFLLCPERYNRRYNMNKVKAEKAPQLDRGTLVHVGCEVYYEALKNGTTYQDAVNQALSKIREAGVTSSDLEPEAVERVMDVMEEYFDYWRVEDQNYEIVEVEKSFLVLIYEDEEVRIFTAGKIDLITNDKDYTNLPHDHKSYDRDFPVSRMTNQFRCYANALNSNWLVVDRIGFQKTLKPFEKFKRPKLSYDKYAIQQWKDNVVRQILFHYLPCVADNIWPMNETSCDKYHRQCEYYEVCDASGQPAKMYKLNANYQTIEPWDVTKVLRKATEVVADAQKEREVKSPVILD